MPAPLYVQVWHDGQCLQEVPFSGDRLQIGRLPENDLVLNHLSVSRIHAQLERDGSEVMVEDLGSQNGVWLGEQRVAGRAIAPLEEPIRIGQHEIRVHREAQVEDEAEFPAPMPASVDGPTGTVSDVLRARPLPPAVRPGFAEDPPSPEAPEGRAEASVTGENGLADLSPFAIDEDEIADDAPLPEGVAELSPDELFDVDDDPTSLVDLSEPDAGNVSSTLERGAELHPGLIIQESGQIERVIVWDEDELIAGRGSRCQILLQAPEISRRHARFVREGNRFEVRDLGSINGVFVNDTRVNHHELQVGDVVRIDAFEITFVLDPQPIADGVEVASAEPQEVSGTDQQHPTRMAGGQAREADWSERGVSELPEAEAEVEAEPSRPPDDEADLAALVEPEALAAEEPWAPSALEAEAEGAEAADPESRTDLEDLDDLSTDPGDLLEGLAPEDLASDPEGLDALDSDSAGSEDPAPEPATIAAEPAEALPALDLVEEAVSGADDEEKDEAEVAGRLELEISVESLPEPLRRALRALGDDLIDVPVRLRFRR